MGLGRLLTRSTVYTATDTVSGVSTVYTVRDNLSPDWPTSSAYRGAMSVPGAWRAALLVAGLLGRLPWDAHRLIMDRPEEKLWPRPPLLEQPNPPETRMSTFRGWGLDYIWDGNAVGVVAARSPLGYPTAVVPVPARYVGVRRVGRWDVSPFPVGAIEYQIGDMRLSPQDVIHIKGPCEPGALRGMGALEAHFNTFSLAQAQDQQARSVSTHGVPTGVLTVDTGGEDLTKDEIADLKSEWLASQATRSIAVLNEVTSFKPLSWNPEEMQLVEARKFTLNMLELIFGLPVGWLGGTDSSRKYANVSQDDVSFMKWTMGDHIEQFEQTLSLAFPRGTTVRANQDAVLQPDTLTRYEAHKIALGDGKTPAWLTVDEVREIEHRPPLPDKPQQSDAFTSGPGQLPGGAPPVPGVQSDGPAMLGPAQDSGRTP